MNRWARQTRRASVRSSPRYFAIIVANIFQKGNSYLFFQLYLAILIENQIGSGYNVVKSGLTKN